MARKSIEKVSASSGLGFGFGVGFGAGLMTGGFGFGGGSLCENPTTEQPKTKIAAKNNCLKYLFIIVIFSHSVFFKAQKGKIFIGASISKRKNDAKTAINQVFQTFCRNNGFKSSDSKISFDVFC